jgi:hypothetical protein
MLALCSALRSLKIDSGSHAPTPPPCHRREECALNFSVCSCPLQFAVPFNRCSSQDSTGIETKCPIIVKNSRLELGCAEVSFCFDGPRSHTFEIVCCRGFTQASEGDAHPAFNFAAGEEAVVDRTCWLSTCSIIICFPSVCSGLYRIVLLAQF